MYLLFLAVVVLSPTNDVQSALVVRAVEVLVEDIGVPWTLASYDRLEMLANVAMVVPAGALAVMAFPRLRWQDWTAYGFSAALAVELAQGLLLPAREAAATDVLANTLGVLAGTGLASAACRLARRPARPSG